MALAQAAKSHETTYTMKENCAVKVEGAGYGIVLSSDENKLFGGRIGKPKVAICPNCGEVSIYIEDVKKLKS